MEAAFDEQVDDDTAILAVYEAFKAATDKVTVAFSKFDLDALKSPDVVEATKHADSFLSEAEAMATDAFRKFLQAASKPEDQGGDEDLKSQLEQLMPHFDELMAEVKRIKEEALLAVKVTLKSKQLFLVPILVRNALQCISQRMQEFTVLRDYYLDTEAFRAFGGETVAEFREKEPITKENDASFLRLLLTRRRTHVAETDIELGEELQKLAEEVEKEEKEEDQEENDKPSSSSTRPKDSEKKKASPNVMTRRTAKERSKAEEKETAKQSAANKRLLQSEREKSESTRPLKRQRTFDFLGSGYGVRRFRGITSSDDKPAASGAASSSSASSSSSNAEPFHSEWTVRDLCKVFDEDNVVGLGEWLLKLGISVLFTGDPARVFDERNFYIAFKTYWEENQNLFKPAGPVYREIEVYYKERHTLGTPKPRNERRRSAANLLPKLFVAIETEVNAARKLGLPGPKSFRPSITNVANIIWVAQIIRMSCIIQNETILAICNILNFNGFNVLNWVRSQNWSDFYPHFFASTVPTPAPNATSAEAQIYGLPEEDRKTLNRILVTLEKPGPNMGFDPEGNLVRQVKAGGYDANGQYAPPEFDLLEKEQKALRTFADLPLIKPMLELCLGVSNATDRADLAKSQHYRQRDGRPTDELTDAGIYLAIKSCAVNILAMALPLFLASNAREFTRESFLTFLGDSYTLVLSLAQNPGETANVLLGSGPGSPNVTPLKEYLAVASTVTAVSKSFLAKMIEASRLLVVGLVVTEMQKIACALTGVVCGGIIDEVMGQVNPGGVVNRRKRLYDHWNKAMNAPSRGSAVLRVVGSVIEPLRKRWCPNQAFFWLYEHDVRATLRFLHATPKAELRPFGADVGAFLNYLKSHRSHTFTLIAGNGPVIWQTLNVAGQFLKPLVMNFLDFWNKIMDITQPDLKAARLASNITQADPASITAIQEELGPAFWNLMKVGERLAETAYTSTGLLLMTLGVGMVFFGYKSDGKWKALGLGGGLIAFGVGAKAAGIGVLSTTSALFSSAIILGFGVAAGLACFYKIERYPFNDRSVIVTIWDGINWVLKSIQHDREDFFGPLDFLYAGAIAGTMMTFYQLWGVALSGAATGASTLIAYTNGTLFAPLPLTQRRLALHRALASSARTKALGGGAVVRFQDYHHHY